MYDNNRLVTALDGLVGWRDEEIDDLSYISESLQISLTGLYFNDTHPLLTIKNIKSICPKEVQDDRTLFNQWLTLKTKAAITKIVERFYSEKMTEQKAKSILENRVLFDGTGRMSDVVTKTNSLVGFELIPIRAKGVVVRLDKIGLQMMGTGDVTIKLYHSSQPIALQTKTFTRTNNGGMQWFDLGFELPYLSNLNNAGGSWYLVYDEGATQQTAIFTDRDWAKAPCTCNRNEYQSYKLWSQFLNVVPIKCGTENFDNRLETYHLNYGINLQLSVVCDMTDIIIEQKRAFGNAIALQMACDMIREMIYNPNARINRNEDNIQSGQMLYELDGDSSSYKKSGLVYRLDTALGALKIDMTGINKLCLPCRTGGIRYGAV